MRLRRILSVVALVCSCICLILALICTYRLKVENSSNTFIYHIWGGEEIQSLTGFEEALDEELMRQLSFIKLLSLYFLVCFVHVIIPLLLISFVAVGLLFLLPKHRYYC